MKQYTISIDRAAVKSAIFVESHIVREFLPYVTEQEAIERDMQWTEQQGDSEADTVNVVYPRITSVKMIRR